MSQIPPYRPAPGQPASAAAMNGLFTGVASATAAINADNVRSQGVDIAQVETSPVDDQGRVTRFVGKYNPPSSTTVNDSTTTTVAEWDLLAGAEYDIGNVARIYTSFQAQNIVRGLAQYGGASDAINAERIQRQQLFSGAGWVFWLEWDVTSTARTNYVPVPGQDDFGTYLANITDDAGSPVPHIRTAQTAATMLVPHLYCTQKSGGDGVVLNPVNGRFSNPIRRSRSYHYQRTGTNARIYGIRLRARGVCSIGVDPAGTGQGIFYVRDTVLWTGGGGSEWDDYSFNNESITVGNIELSMLVQVPQ